MTKLSYYCKSCNKKNFIKVKSSNRYDLKHEIGHELKRDCSYCKAAGVTHINRLYAEVEPTTILVIGVLCLLIAVVIFLFGWIVSIAFTLPFYYFFHQQRRANQFNKLKIPRS